MMTELFVRRTALAAITMLALCGVPARAEILRINLMPIGGTMTAPAPSLRFTSLPPNSMSPRNADSGGSAAKLALLGIATTSYSRVNETDVSLTPSSSASRAPIDQFHGLTMATAAPPKPGNAVPNLTALPVILCWFCRYRRRSRLHLKY